VSSILLLLLSTPFSLSDFHHTSTSIDHTFREVCSQNIVDQQKKRKNHIHGVSASICQVTYLVSMYLQLQSERMAVGHNLWYLLFSNFHRNFFLAMLKFHGTNHHKTFDYRGDNYWIHSPYELFSKLSAHHRTIIRHSISVYLNPQKMLIDEALESYPPKRFVNDITI
jgi:hypothetical protein